MKNKKDIRMELEVVDYIEFFKEWQTLLAGGIALFGALITTAMLMKQHSFDKKKHREDQHKNEFYMRSLIPDALSALISYSAECFKYVYDGTELPNKPNEAISTLKENIKYSDLKTSKNLFEIVSFYQVHNSRINSYQKDIAMNKKESMLYDIAKLDHYFNSLFSYARNETKSVQRIFPNEREMRYAVKAMIGMDRYYSNSTKFDGIFTQVEDRRRLEEKYSKPRLIRKFHYFFARLQGKLQSKWKSIQSFIALKRLIGGK